MDRVVRIVVGSVLVFVLAATSALAQAAAQINGTVADPSGGVLPGATVAAIQTDTGFRREVVTETDGAFTLTALQSDVARYQPEQPEFRPVSGGG